MEKFTEFARIAEIEFADIVLSTQYLGHKLRIYLKDKSFIDFFYTTTLKKQRFSLHWEKSHTSGDIYRIDNAPDKKWAKVDSFPIHFHNKKYDNVEPSPFVIDRKTSLETIFKSFFHLAQKQLGSK